MQDESIGSRPGLETIEITLDDGTTFYIQAKTLGGESNVGIKNASFEKVTQAIEGVARKLNDIWKRVEPSKASVEFGVEFVIGSGEVMALFVENSTTASMKITLEWGRLPSE